MNETPLNGHSVHPHDRESAGGLEARDGARAAAADVQRPAHAMADLKALVKEAREAHYEWRLRPFSERAAALRHAAEQMLRRRAEVIDLARMEMGKVPIEGLLNEAIGPLDAVKAWTRIVERATTRHVVPLNPLSFPRKQAYVDLVARGVVGVIAPWNFPVAGLYRSTFPALLTGNGVVVKPSEYTPRTSGWFVERLAESLPRGLVQLATGDGRVGAALLESGIDACVFTGSPETGRIVQVRCAERGIACSVEMGGKDPAIVLADCDLARTVAGVTHWSLSNAGQACGAIELAYVDESIADAFVEALRDAWTRLRVGSDRCAEVAPLANRRQLDIVAAHVEDARAKGAVVVCGGARTGEGLGYLPTLLDRCDERMKVVTSETFGPVLAIVRVAGAAEAVRRTNASRYGLGASLWTRDLARAKRLAERLDVGVVTINNHAISGGVPALPWSGTRDTGLGIANSALSLGTFARPRATIVDRWSAPEVYWMPYDDTLWKLGDIIAGLQVGRVLPAWRAPLLLVQRVRTVRRFFRRD